MTTKTKQIPKAKKENIFQPFPHYMIKKRETINRVLTTSITLGATEGRKSPAWALFPGHCLTEEIEADQVQLFIHPRDHSQQFRATRSLLTISWAVDMSQRCANWASCGHESAQNKRGKWFSETSDWVTETKRKRQFSPNMTTVRTEQ